MNKSFSILGFALSLVVTSGAFAAVELPKADATWIKIADDDGILVHKKKVEGSDLVAFRGETVIDGNIAKVANVLYDTKRKTEWVAKIVSAKDVDLVSERERIEYNHTGSGFFIVKDRDFVFHAKADLDIPNKRMILNFHSVETPKMPPVEGNVRGEIKEGQYILTAVEEGKKTHLVVEIQVDPKGSIPAWLVNVFQKGWPRTTLTNIQKQVNKADVGELASVRKNLLDPPAAATAGLDMGAGADSAGVAAPAKAKSQKQ